MDSECLWDTPPIDITLSQNEVHVWCVSLDQPASHVHSLTHVLSENEQKRAERFHFDRHRRRYIVSQGSLRTILGRYLDLAPEQIVFSRGVRGKPALKATQHATVEEGRLQFNTSHSHELALYAIARGREVGIDIEHIRPMSDAEQIVKRFFSDQERTVFQSLAPDQKLPAFFTCWTRKEAFTKARGEGLYRPLDQFVVSFSPGEPARLLSFEEDPQETSRWSFHSLTPAPGYTAALVVEGQSWRLSCWRMEETFQNIGNN
jgi:4'-phosphopantetheinyl transferase